MADLGIIFLRRKHTIHWYQSLFTIMTGSMPFRYFWATLYCVFYCFYNLYVFPYQFYQGHFQTIDWPLLAQYYFAVIKGKTLMKAVWILGETHFPQYLYMF